MHFEQTFFFILNLDPDLHCLKIPDLDPTKMYADPKLWFKCRKNQMCNTPPPPCTGLEFLVGNLVWLTGSGAGVPFGRTFGRLKTAKLVRQ